MMVRYSDRGLVKNGVVSKLFGHLYLAFTIIISLWGSAIGFIAYIFNSSSNLKHDAFMQFCTDQTQERNSIALALKTRPNSLIDTIASNNGQRREMPYAN